MTYQEILNNRTGNRNSLISYFNRVNVPTNKVDEVEVHNGRNCKCSALRLTCESEQEYNKYKQSFYWAVNHGGDFLQCDPRFNELTITIKDGWN